MGGMGGRSDELGSGGGSNCPKVDAAATKAAMKADNLRKDLIPSAQLTTFESDSQGLNPDDSQAIFNHPGTGDSAWTWGSSSRTETLPPRKSGRVGGEKGFPS